MTKGTLLPLGIFILCIFQFQFYAIFCCAFCPKVNSPRGISKSWNQGITSTAHRPLSSSSSSSSLDQLPYHQRRRNFRDFFTAKGNQMSTLPSNNRYDRSKNRLRLSTSDDSQEEEEEGGEAASDAENIKSKKDLNEDGNYSDDSIDFVWEVGNIENDFQALEQAINFENADFNLLEVERVERMDAFAAQRRLFLPDLHAFVTRPLRWSLVFVVLQRILQRKSSSKVAHFIARHRLVALPWDIHFWAVVVAAPILFLQVKKFTMAPPEPMPDDLKGLDSAYMQFVTTDWRDPETSCRDYVLCLAEQWVSAVKSMAWFGFFRLGCFAATNISILSNTIRVVPYFPSSTVAFLQMLTRLGAMVSIYQFPKLIFKLQREQQPRPIRRGVSNLQRLVKAMLEWGLPIGIASDLSKVLMVLPNRALVAFYGIAVASLSAMEIMYNPSRKPPPLSDTDKQAKLRKKQELRKTIFHVAQLATAAIASACFMTITSVFLFRQFYMKKTLVFKIPWLHLVSNGALLMVLIRPLCHFRAFKRIFSVVYMHDLSLAGNVRELLSNPQEVENRYNWRHRLRWRKPERIHTIVDKLTGDGIYWWIIKGSVEDKLIKEREEDLKEESKRESSNVLQLVEKDMFFNPFDTKPDRDLWKAAAMDNVARFHQEDYDNKSFADPLGVAVQQTLGIGLRFIDDHTRRLAKGEKPSTGRLQARAAKSAVDRVQKLYTERNQQSTEVKEKVKDPLEQKKQLDQIREKVDDEVASLAKRLSDLIPTGASDPNDGPGLKFQNFIPNSKLDANGHKVRFPSDYEKSYAVESLIRMQDKIGTGDPSNEHPNPNDAIEVVPLSDETDIKAEENDIGTQQSDGDREEFVETYLKQKFGGGKKADEEDDNDEDGPDIILV